MSRHVLDHDRKHTGLRAEHFARIERLVAPEGNHRAARALLRRPQTRIEGLRTARFLRVDRTGEARI